MLVAQKESVKPSFDMKPWCLSFPSHCHPKDSKHVEPISPSSVSLFSSDFLFFFFFKKQTLKQQQLQC